MKESLIDIVRRMTKKQQAAARASGDPLGLPFPRYREYDPNEPEIQLVGLFAHLAGAK